MTVEVPLAFPAWVAAARATAGRTEGRLSLMLAAVLTALIAAGTVGTVALADRWAAANAETARLGTAVSAAGEARRALSEADALSFTAVLVNAETSPESRALFRNDIASVARQLSAAWGGDVASRLPVYSGLVETGWVYARQGQPLGAAYLRQAAHLLHKDVLPVVERAVAADTAALREAQRDAGSVPWTALAVGVLALAVLARVQVSLARRTHRRANPGLFAATLLVLLALGWVFTATLAAAGAAERAVRDGLDPATLAAEARVHGLAADSHEAQVLIFRDNTSPERAEFSRSLKVVDDRINQLLDGESGITDPATREALSDARLLAALWRGVPTNSVESARPRIEDLGKPVRDERASDSYTRALAFVTDDTASTFDGHIASATTHATDRFNEAAADARGALGWALPGFLTLLATAIAAAAAGMWPRLVEYR
ncbi:hypothetical protein ACTG9Q_30630 [Actinokineospora sp. 24-640]